jgi:lysozyme family protein
MRYLLPVILRLSTNNEGGYSNHPKDPGGPTNHGITIATLRAYRQRPVSIDDVKRLSLDEANKIYEQNYWRPIWGDKLPAGLDYALFDFGINSGPSRAVKTLQGLLPGVAIDGVMGVKTLTGIEAADTAVLIKRLCDERLKFCRKLKTWKDFGRGWTYRVTGTDPDGKFKRVNGVVGDALAMVKQKPISLLPFPLDDIIPIGKARDIDQKVFAPLGNKLQGGIVGSIVGGGALSQLPSMLPSIIPGLQQAQSSLETVKDVSQVFAWILGLITVILALVTILHTIQKARETGLET